MVKEGVFEEFNYEIKADKDHAQILVELTPLSKPFEEVEKVIEGLGAHIIEMYHLSESQIMVKLDVDDMRNIALSLTENGFINVRGINALGYRAVTRHLSNGEKDD